MTAGDCGPSQVQRPGCRERGIPVETAVAPQSYLKDTYAWGGSFNGQLSHIPGCLAL